jgi:thiol:disulfide interchange protein DsbC
MKRFHRSIALILILIPALALTAQAFPPKKGDKACIDCHKLDKKDAEVIVKKVVPTGTVTDVKLSPIKGVWQIDVDAGEGKHGALYLDFSKKYLVAGQIVPVESIGRQTPQKVEVSKIPLENAIFLGSKDAPKKVIVFSDPDCPLPMHKDAFKKAQAVQCSKSAEMLDDAFSGKTVPEPTCPPDQIEKNKALAASLNFNGTPVMVRDDGTVHSGYLLEQQLLDWIDKKQ